MPRVFKRAAARRDLVEHNVYQAENAGEALADRFLACAEACFTSLSEHPALRGDTTEIIVSKPTFHTMVIAGREFEALLSADGPYISCGLEGVALGSCTTIELLSPELDSGVGRHRVSSPSWGLPSTTRSLAYRSSQ